VGWLWADPAAPARGGIVYGQDHAGSWTSFRNASRVRCRHGLLGSPEKFTPLVGSRILSAAIVCQKRLANEHQIGTVAANLVVHAADNEVYRRCSIILALRCAVRPQAL
jgi:hypothetical protein